MRRREFFVLLGGAATAWPLAARAQDAGRTYRIGFLLPSPRNSPAAVAMFDQLRLNGIQQAAENRGVEALIRGVAKRDDVNSAIKDVQAAGVQAINFLATPMFSVDAADFIAQVTKLRLPSIYQFPESAEDGALIGYGPRFTGVYRMRANMAVKVLRGTMPADIPIEQPTRFELIINLKTAKTIGHPVPSSLLLHADRVIE